MSICCNSLQGIGNNGCGCGCNNSMTIIVAAIIALVLVNILDQDTANCIGQFLQAIGELMDLSATDGCFGNLANNNICNYY
ncbi:MAG: hypothetical protein U0L26_00490 [Cellulosilyticum sp.]|nr:hypothetical protein [Cellulosilyticum sp.]MEE1070872.1 hypothetical protein [Cellulosilyticum sp.]